jgi:hypothetical protein
VAWQDCPRKKFVCQADSGLPSFALGPVEALSSNRDVPNVLQRGAAMRWEMKTLALSAGLFAELFAVFDLLACI